MAVNVNATTPTTTTNVSAVTSSVVGSNLITTGMEPYVSDLRSGNLHQVTSSNAASAAFKWVEQIISPDMFANADSTIIMMVPALASQYNPATAYPLLGLCTGFQYSISNNISTFKELRAEHTIIVPQKSQPGSLSLTRILGAFPNFVGAMNAASCWASDNQARAFKKQFGLLLMYLNYSRSHTIGALYFERCAVAGVSSAIQAREHEMYEQISVVFDRVLDNKTNATVGSQGAATGTVTTPSSGTTITNNSGEVLHTTYNTTADVLAAQSASGTNGANTVSLESQRASNPSSLLDDYEAMLTWAVSTKTSIESNGNQAAQSVLYVAVTEFISYYTGNVRPYLRLLYDVTGSSRAMTSAELASFTNYKNTLNNKVAYWRTKGYSFS